MKIITQFLFLISFMTLLSCSGKKEASELSRNISEEVSANEMVYGIYGNPKSLMEKHPQLSELGINAVFARKSSLSEEMLNSLRADSIGVYVEFPLLNGKEYLKDHPEAWPINEKGEKAPAADWFMGVCLTDTAFRNSKVNELNEFLDKKKVDGIWLDYLHWHAQFETPEPILPETCFCDRCIHLFSQSMEVEVPQGTTVEIANYILGNHERLWRDWRADVLSQWVADFKGILKAKQPKSLLGLYYCPWFPEEYDSALYNNLGINMEALSSLADALSPMVYHGKMGRQPEYVKEYTEWLSTKVNEWGHDTKIWPIVQAHDDPAIISPEEFRQVMEYGLSGNSAGVMMFSVYSLVEDTAKIQVMKEVYK